MGIILNPQRGHVTTRDMANASYVIADFASPNSSVETVTGVAISRILWTGDWVIKRGGVVVFQTANNVGVFDLTKHAISLTDNTAANLTVNTTSTSATLILQLSKKSNVLLP